MRIWPRNESVGNKSTMKEVKMPQKVEGFKCEKAEGIHGEMKY